MHKFLFILTFLLSGLAIAEVKSHGFALYGTLKYDQNFTHFDYVNPDAPKGGLLKLVGMGTFDSLNPYLLKGTSPWNTPGLGVYGFGEWHDTLLAGTDEMRPSGDEPQSAYGLIAQSLEYPRDYRWVIFNLNPNARFHDGHRITSEDVVFSFNTLVKKGHPRYQFTYAEVDRVEALSPLQVKFYFKEPGKRTLILRAGELPVLPKHFFKTLAFTETGMTPILGNGPYKITSIKPGRSITFSRVKDYWAKDLPVNKGRYNFDEVQFDFYRDSSIAFEAFKAGEYDIHVDYVAKNWASNYEFPAVQQGKVIKKAIPHQQAQGSQAFFFNLRNPLFQDRRVREAISLMFDFEWSNKALFNNAYQRSNSYFPNSPFSATGTPEGRELEILKPFRTQLPQDLFTEPFQLSHTDGSGNLRKQRKKALALLKAAGWTIQSNKLVNEKTGEPFSFEQVNLHSASLERIILPFKKNLASIGIDMSIRMLDAALYKTVLDNFDFDMTIFVLPQSLSPGQELRNYFHSANAEISGSLNYAGIENTVVDHLVEAIIKAETQTELIVLVKALDRVLLWEKYTIPHWHMDYFRVAYWNKFKRPEEQPPYILGIQNWWLESSN